MNQQEHTDKITRALSAIEAEKATIAAIVLNPSVLGWIEVHDSHFTLPLHKATFEAMVGLWANDKPLDDITILDALEKSSPGVTLADIGKILSTSFTGDNVEHWVEILEEHRRKRVLSAVSANAANSLLGGDTSEAIFDVMVTALAEISSEAKAASEDMEEVGYRVEEMLLRAWDGTKTSRLPTGIDSLDDKITGFPVGVPTALGARPGVGKSLTLWNIANAAVQRGEHVIILTNEDNADRTYKLGLAYHSGVERRKLESTELTELQRASIIEAIANTAEANSRFHFVKVHGKKMSEICRMAKALIRKYEPTIIALDYIQNVPNPEAGMNRNYGIEENLTLFDALIAEEDIVGIIVGQLKRMEPGAIPTMSDFKDSGSIEQKAKLMLTLSDVLSQNGGKHYPGEANFRIGVVKNSEGLSDFDVDCIVDKGLGKFTAVKKSAFPHHQQQGSFQ